MRPITMMASCLLVAAPILSLDGSPVQADTNDFMGQAQRFSNNRGDDRDSYDRGRDDEMRRQQAFGTETTIGVTMIGIEAAMIAIASPITAIAAANWFRKEAACRHQWPPPAARCSLQVWPAAASSVREGSHLVNRRTSEYVP